MQALDTPRRHGGARWWPPPRIARIRMSQNEVKKNTTEVSTYRTPRGHFVRMHDDSVSLTNERATSRRTHKRPGVINKIDRTHCCGRETLELTTTATVFFTKTKDVLQEILEIKQTYSRVSWLVGGRSRLSVPTLCCDKAYLALISIKPLTQATKSTSRQPRRHRTYSTEPDTAVHKRS